MKTNIGKTDQFLRIVAGAILIGLGVAFDKWFWAIGMDLLLVGLFKWSLLYKIVGFTTRENQK